MLLKCLEGVFILGKTHYKPHFSTVLFYISISKWLNFSTLRLINLVINAAINLQHYNSEPGINVFRWFLISLVHHYNSTIANLTATLH